MVRLPPRFYYGTKDFCLSMTMPSAQPLPGRDGDLAQDITHTVADPSSGSTTTSGCPSLGTNSCPTGGSCSGTTIHHSLGFNPAQSSQGPLVPDKAMAQDVTCPILDQDRPQLDKEVPPNEDSSDGEDLFDVAQAQPLQPPSQTYPH
ncbi:hypothetical protein TWF718_006778 [Orbilia javanica]|uniref:Uncharacterized protein n=1 Tax=Orbilia javanica TaxID=47235 RepID=A0AAN8MQQ9_9PEZI